MNIIVVTKHLDEYAGSELFTRDLCLGLSRAGHAVAAYAWEPGAVSAEMAEEGIEVVSDIRALSGRRFDVIHAQHGITAALARAFFPDVPMVYLVHGVISEFERLPGADPGVSVFAGVSEEVAEDVRRRYGLPEGAVRMLRNPVDTERFSCTRPVSAKPERLLVLSNHLTAEVRRTIETACDRADIAVSHVGLPENPQRDVERFMCRADIVVTLGRGVLEAMSCGRNIIVYDKNGGDGFVDMTTLPIFRERNFSGRTRGRRFSADEFEAELSKYDPSLGVRLREYVEREHGIVRAVATAEGFYREAMAMGPAPERGLRARLLLTPRTVFAYVHVMIFGNRAKKVWRLLRRFPSLLPKR